MYSRFTLCIKGESGILFTFLGNDFNIPAFQKRKYLNEAYDKGGVKYKMSIIYKN